MDKSKLKPFVELAKQTDSVDEFIDKVRGIQVSYEVSEWFERQYNSTGMLSVEKASAEFIEDVKKGKFEFVTNPYLYRRKEVRL